MNKHYHSVPLLRLYNGAAKDHFYTTSESEANNAAKVHRYTLEGLQCNIFTQQYERTVPLYRLYKGAAADHFYTTSADEKDSAIARYKYSFEGITGYVYPDGASMGTVSLYRLCKGGGDADHFYTTSAAEKDNAVARYKYSFEGIACYVYPDGANHGSEPDTSVSYSPVTSSQQASSDSSLAKGSTEPGSHCPAPAATTDSNLAVLSTEAWSRPVNFNSNIVKGSIEPTARNKPVLEELVLGQPRLGTKSLEYFH